MHPQRTNGGWRFLWTVGSGQEGGKGAASTCVMLECSVGPRRYLSFSAWGATDLPDCTQFKAQLGSAKTWGQGRLALNRRTLTEDLNTRTSKPLLAVCLVSNPKTLAISIPKKSKSCLKAEGCYQRG